MAKNIKIAICDDEEVMRRKCFKICQDVISHYNRTFEILEYTDGNEIDREDIDILILDIEMPVMDGYKATMEIRELENKQLSRIPIIAMTANAFVEDKQKAMEVGMDGHISKPIEMEELNKVLCKEKKKKNCIRRQ